MRNLLSTLTALSCIFTLSAAAATWNGDGGDNDWQNGDNWVSDSVPADGDPVVFPDGVTVAPNGDPVVGNITFEGSANITDAGTLTIQGNTVAGGGDIDADVVLENNVLLTDSSGNTLRFDGEISENGGSYSLATDVSGGGAVLLSSSNTYSGGTYVSNGQCRVHGDNIAGVLGTGPIYFTGGDLGFFATGKTNWLYNTCVLSSKMNVTLVNQTVAVFAGKLEGANAIGFNAYSDGCAVIIEGDEDDTADISKIEIQRVTFQCNKTAVFNADPSRIEFPSWANKDGTIVMNENVVWDENVWFSGNAVYTLGGINTRGKCRYTAAPEYQNANVNNATIYLTQASGGTSVYEAGFNCWGGIIGGFTKIGGGVTRFDAANEFGRTLFIEEGELLCNNAGALSTSVVVIAEGGTIAGVVTAGAAITNNGTIAPGLSVGTLGGTDLVMNEGCIYDCEFAGASADLIDMAGTLTLPTAANSVTVDVSTIGGASGSQPIFGFASLAGSTDSLYIDLTDAPMYNDYNLTSDSDSIDLELIPEPGVIGALSIALVLFRRK